MPQRSACPASPCRLLGSLLFLLVVVPSVAPAQEGPPLRIFLDCATRCDGEFLRIEMTDVSWVTDRTVSDVHVIATRLSTGAGGREVTLAFIGRAALAGLRDTVIFRTPPDATDDRYRREFLRVLELGLVRYKLAAGVAQSLAIVRTPVGDDAPAVARRDPWNFWVFEVGLDVELDGESREKRYQVGSDLRADRITEDWKIRLRLGGDLDRTTFTLDEGEEFTANRDRWYGSALAVRSLSPHWSVGVKSGVRSSAPDNLDLRVRVAPAIEWNLYPYDEATRRQLVLLYSVGATRYNYVEETIFSKLAETRLDHSLQVAYATQQPWGRASLSGTAAVLLDDWARNSLGIRGQLGVRLARGLEVDIRASYSRVRDQITIPKGDATDQEIFLELRELATDYRANVEVGLSYTFGSFFNTIVNPRFNSLD